MPPFPVPLSQSLLHGGLEIDCLSEEVEAGARAALLWGITEMQPSPDPRLSFPCCYLHWEKTFGVQDSRMAPCSWGSRMLVIISFMGATWELLLALYSGVSQSWCCLGDHLQGWRLKGVAACKASAFPLSCLSGPAFHLMTESLMGATECLASSG